MAAYTKKTNIKTYGLVLLSFIMALMSKPVVVTLPIIFILLDYWPLGRILSTTQNVNADGGNRGLFSTRGHFFKIPLWPAWKYFWHSRKIFSEGIGKEQIDTYSKNNMIHKTENFEEIEDEAKSVTV